jgi:xylan 1,4-beta-xylosidase
MYPMKFFLLLYITGHLLTELVGQDLKAPKWRDASNIRHFAVDLSQSGGVMDPVYAWFGYDEPNYTYMKDGRKLLTELAELSPVPVYVRTHNLLTSGDGQPALKWGSTNAYTEDANGHAIYDWTIIDKIIDAYIERGMKPLMEIGFMPEALSSHPTPYRHSWTPQNHYSTIFTGWAYPPKDYGKWAELVYQWVSHSVHRYGKEEVESWLWELWNEPNIGYWQGSVDEYIKLYDYTADAVKRALPGATMGGPHTTGPASEKAEAFLRTFLEHCLEGTNYVSGVKGSPLDFIAFHAKGSPEFVDGRVVMNLGKQLRDISKGFEIVASYPSLKHLPIIIGESDPEGCAACSMDVYPHNGYRNGTMYPSYTAAAFARKFDLADFYNINFKGAVSWAFEFEDQPWFHGFRDLATHGIDKPVLNVFRMFGMMRGDRVPVSGAWSYNFQTLQDSSVRHDPDIGVLAAKDEHSASLMVWYYHDVDEKGVSFPVQLSLSSIPSDQVQMHHYRIDEDHSNAYAVWLKMGSPQHPDAEQYSKLERAGFLEMLEPPAWKKVHAGEMQIELDLPRHSVSLIELTW